MSPCVLPVSNCKFQVLFSQIGLCQSVDSFLSFLYCWSLVVTQQLFILLLFPILFYYICVCWIAMAFVVGMPLPGKLASCATSCGWQPQHPHHRLAGLRQARIHAGVTDSDEGTLENGSSSSSNGGYRNTASAQSTGTTVDTDAHEVPATDLKCELYAAVASINRGFNVPPDMRRNIESLIEQLERVNSCPNPSERPLLFAGNWRLLYTNALDVLSLGLLSPVALVNQVYQNIVPASVSSAPTADFNLQNIVELEPAPAPVANKFIGRTMARVVVNAKGFVKSRSVISLTFENVSFQPSSFLGYQFPSTLRVPKIPLNSPVGKIDTTYLDEDIRISRANVNGRTDNIFVLIREPWGKWNLYKVS